MTWLIPRTYAKCLIKSWYILTIKFIIDFCGERVKATRPRSTSGFGDKPSPDIASNSINTLAKVSQAELPEAARELQEHVYVDDIGGSKPTVAEAKQITSDMDTILEKGQFQIKCWHSNSKELDQSDGERFKKREIIGQFETLTKRNCLALVAQLWDPIGLVSPVTIKFRIHLQEFWSSGFG